MRDQEKMAALNRNILAIGAMRDITCVHHIFPLHTDFLNNIESIFLAKVLLNTSFL